MAVTRDRISIHDDLVRAINEKRVIEFVYKTPGLRLAEPHDYGVKNDVDMLRAYQLSGASRSRAPHGWRHIDVADIQECWSGAFRAAALTPGTTTAGGTSSLRA
jgi:hypothetical protein